MARGNAGTLVGKTLGRYQLITLLGAGGMAEVYRGRDLSLGRDVAVKVLPATLAADPEYVERFRSEARRVARLRHPNIVPVYEFDEHDGLLYLVMPLVPESLRDRMQRDGLVPISDAIGIAIQVAGALEAAHAQGIVHRDVKPENVLLDADGHALLTDFGIARELAFLRRSNAVQTLAATGLPVGTPEYMAPEQLRNGPIDQRADVYALGAVLYELLTGRAPHEAATPYEVAALALTAPIARPSTRNPRLWPELDAAVMKALAPDPSSRFQTVAAFAQALRQASRRGTGVGAALRLTLPIFRKTAIINPYEGPTGEIVVADVHGWPTDTPATRSAAMPTVPVTRRIRSWPRRTDGGRPAPLLGLVLGLAVVVVLSSLILLRAAGMFGPSSPPRVELLPTATATATATPKPTATPRPTATPTPISLGDTGVFVQTDSKTEGTWRGTYGSRAFDVFLNNRNLPSWVTVTPKGRSDFTWAATTRDIRALQRVEDVNTRIAATWYSSTSYTIDITMTDNAYHQLALYCVDWDTTSRAQTVQLVDGTTGNVLDTRHVSTFHNGIYLVWKVSGHVVIKLTRTAGYNAVASGLFLD